ncbi:hypothetical protein M0R45_003448 [Rubus argutus]|uniref:non-specific serine/threonine protein kinase n=1 Tax=Rubus argutus TaxID=59490 RepID=A0AAW1YIL6_RUBAR
MNLNICSQSPESSTISTRSLALILSLSAVFLLVGFLLVILLGQRLREEKGWIGLRLEAHCISEVEFHLIEDLVRVDRSNVIGSGGSGKVYRVPVNRTVKLMCCISSETSKLLVYEYLDKRSLDRWLHKRNRPPLSNLSTSVNHVFLDWPKRLQIALGAAKGLCYMHHDCVPPVIHRDMKSSNILLDADFNAKIADFGLAKMLVKQGELCTMSAVAGSFGYMAPEYAPTTRVNEKIDVYSFGVILLELKTGREPSEGDEHTSLAEWAWRHAQESNSMADALGPGCQRTLRFCHILVRTCPPSVRREKTEYTAAPLLKNSNSVRDAEFRVVLKQAPSNATTELCFSPSFTVSLPKLLKDSQDSSSR